MNTAIDMTFGWQAACGGTEQPFNFQGKRYHYLWHKVAGVHAYYCITDDLFLGDEEAEHLWNRGQLKVLL